MTSRWKVQPETNTKVDDVLSIRVHLPTEGIDPEHPVTISGDLRVLFPDDELFESNHEAEDAIRRQLPGLEIDKTVFDSEYSCFFAYTDTVERAQIICNYIANRVIPDAYAAVARKALAGRSNVKLYTVITDHADGGRSISEGLTINDVVSLVGGLDNLSIVECSILPEKTV